MKPTTSTHCKALGFQSNLDSPQPTVHLTLINIIYLSNDLMKILYFMLFPLGFFHSV